MNSVVAMAIEEVPMYENRIDGLPVNVHSWLREPEMVKKLFDIRDYFPSYYKLVYRILDLASKDVHKTKESTTRMMLSQVYACANTTHLLQRCKH